MSHLPTCEALDHNSSMHTKGRGHVPRNRMARRCQNREKKVVTLRLDRQRSNLVATTFAILAWISTLTVAVVAQAVAEEEVRKVKS